jgi:hypothetical protein
MGTNLEVELVVSRTVSVQTRGHPPCPATSVDTLSGRMSPVAKLPGNRVESQSARRIVSGAQGGDHLDNPIVIARRSHGIP